MSRETRRPPTDAELDVTFTQTGRVTHDDRGNAIWEWAGKDAETAEIPCLSLADDSPPPKVGYSPYDSGVREKKQAHRKTDLRRLSEWMKLKKSAEKAKSGAE